jgi:3D-(3,5/4)-trihydroxycyclohexane-1,2-dione acylhydrolase (decyclizing)
VATRVTVADALVRYLAAQRIEQPDGTEAPLFPAVFAIFGHGNVTSLGHALARERDRLPTIRGQNEQGMVLAAAAWAKASRRRQVPVVTSSIGPGALNMVTGAGVAHANRLPVLMLAGDTFASRVPDPVLQQVEHFGDPTVTVNDAFKAVTRWWDRITAPEQLLASLPHAVATMLDRRLRRGARRTGGRDRRRSIGPHRRSSVARGSARGHRLRAGEPARC